MESYICLLVVLVPKVPTRECPSETVAVRVPSDSWDADDILYFREEQFAELFAATFPKYKDFFISDVTYLDDILLATPRIGYYGSAA